MKELQCPLPISNATHVLPGHGGGGRLMHQLIEQVFLPAFANKALSARHDGAVVEVGGRRLAFTTGGDIGRLAVNGTVNDLAMCGARPLFLSAACVIEEGLPIETLRKVAASMADAAREAGVQLVTGDTKVVERGKGDGLFITTSGIGLVERDLAIGPASVRPGDAILLNGDIGRHGMAIMAVREGLSFETEIQSDCAPLSGLVLKMLEAGLEPRCLRDLTRGGLATALVEIAEAAKLRIDIRETAIPVREDVGGACEMLGFDPLYVANEGRFVAFLPAAQAERALEIMRGDPLGRDACLIGEVSAKPDPVVAMKTRIGASRLVDMLSGEQLPRIC